MSEAGTTPAAMRYGHGFQVPPEEYLDYPPGKLPVALEGSDPYGRRAGEPCRLQQGHKLNRDHAEHEPVERHDERKENDPDDAHASFEHGTVWRRRRRRRWIRGVLRRIAARESEPVQRQTDREVDGGEGDQRAALAIGFVQVVADDPEHGRGVRTVEGEVEIAFRPRDGVTCTSAANAASEAASHADAEHSPDGKVARLAPHLRQRHEPRRNDDRAGAHHDPRASSVDQPSHPRRDEDHHQEGNGEAEKHRGHRPSGVGNNGFGENAQTIAARAPRRDLGDAERIYREEHGVQAPAGSGCLLHVGHLTLPCACRLPAHAAG
jgi:hypothetical protein